MIDDKDKRLFSSTTQIHGYADASKVVRRRLNGDKDQICYIHNNTDGLGVQRWGVNYYYAVGFCRLRQFRLEAIFPDITRS